VTDSGEIDLATLLRSMEPILHDGAFVFSTSEELPSPEHLAAAIALFHEPEGTTLVLPADRAGTAGFVWSDPMAWISLTVHSSLKAVGLTAAVAGALRDAGIPCNVVAAFYHDHLFVPLDSADAALAALHRLSGTG
jgi:hypothetical protein